MKVNGMTATVRQDARIWTGGDLQWDNWT